MADFKVLVALLFVVFGWSSWIDVNGLWVELPLMVYQLPEGWNLPSYITVIIQAANIGPLFYTIILFLLKWNWPNTPTVGSRFETGVIFSIITIGGLSILFLSFYWDITSFIGGVEHSTILFVLVFFLSLVDCTSSVTFLPFLAHFKPSYMTAFYVGEGMSGLLPTAIAFIQGSGEYVCVNATVTEDDNSTSYALQPLYADLFFSVRDFFLTLFVMLCGSLAAFSVLRYSQYCKDERVDGGDYTPPVIYQPSADSDSCAVTLNSDDSWSPMITTQSNNDSLSFTRFSLLLAIMATVSALANGFLPSIQIYSLLPYGQLYYSLGVKLATLFNPLACFLGFFLMTQSFAVIGVLTCISCAAATYIICIASFSPTPPLDGTAAAVIMVLVWVIFTGVTSYLKLLVSTVMKKRGHTGLLWLGIFTQIGSLTGAIISLLLTTVFQLFTSAPPC